MYSNELSNHACQFNIGSAHLKCLHGVVRGLLRVIRVNPADVLKVQRMLTAALVAVYIAGRSDTQLIQVAEAGLVHASRPVAARWLLHCLPWPIDTDSCNIASIPISQRQSSVWHLYASILEFTTFSDIVSARGWQGCNTAMTIVLIQTADILMRSLPGAPADRRCKLIKRDGSCTGLGHPRLSLGAITLPKESLGPPGGFA